MTQWSRRWIIASVAAALLLISGVSQLDNRKVYAGLQQQLARSGIQLQADEISISPMYTGSIRLKHVTVQTDSFSLQAEQLYIDLNLAALLTGKALPQALYLQLANIEVKKTQQQQWIELVETESFKLKRIYISQSEIHFHEQHLTLEQVNLDIRDIGKNKNPRLELQAHIGDGRIDAHGYIRLKRGQITRGFSRVKLSDIPLAFINHGTTLETLNGSITTHLNEDKTWQAIGRIALQIAAKDKLELRGKFTGSPQQLFHIDDMVLNIEDSGAFQLSGDCIRTDSCLININSEQLQPGPIFRLIDSDIDLGKRLRDSQLQAINIQHSWKNSILSSSGDITWQQLDYLLTDKKNSAHFNSGTLTFSGLEHHPDGSWLLANAKVTHDKQASLILDKASYNNGRWQLPLKLYNSDLWLPLSNILLQNRPPYTVLEGSGTITGNINIQHQHGSLSEAAFAIDATAATMNWQQYSKPENIHFSVTGEASWQKELRLEDAKLSVQLADSYAAIDKQQALWHLNKLSADLDQAKALGITFPWDLHGSISGQAAVTEDLSGLQSARLDLIDFGVAAHHFSGQVVKQRQKWHTRNLAWTFDKNQAEISSNKRGQLHITANRFNAAGLQLLQYTPEKTSGTLDIQSLTLPFGLFKNVSTDYETGADGLMLKRFKSTFYEGSVRAKKLQITQQDQLLNVKGALQAGGIRLKDWRWLNNQFQTILAGNLYSTINVDAQFDAEDKISSWQGDGDIIVYNGRWVLNNETFKANKLQLSLRKRQQFNSRFNFNLDKQQGQGEIIIDEQKQVSGYLQLANKRFKLSETWPKIHYLNE